MSEFNLSQEPSSAAAFRAILDRTGFLNRPAESLSDGEVIDAMHLMLAVHGERGMQPGWHERPLRRLRVEWLRWRRRRKAVGE